MMELFQIGAFATASIGLAINSDIERRLRMQMAPNLAGGAWDVMLN